MRISRVLFLLPALLPFLVSGCSSGPDFVAKYEPWREEEENACLASGVLAHERNLEGRSALGGPSYCGTAHPFEMTTAMDGRVKLDPPALLRCPMIPQVDHWVTTDVAPAAQYYFGQPLVGLKIAASYSCRPQNNVSGAKLSEHGYANALDVAGFVLADGRTIAVKSGWGGSPEEQAFLRDVHAAGCREFMTVLGPNYDANHRDHFHVDLARHGIGGLKRICR